MLSTNVSITKLSNNLMRRFPYWKSLDLPTSHPVCVWFFILYVYLISWKVI